MFRCRLYLAGSPWCPANIYNSGREGMTQSLMCSGFPRNRVTNSALAPSVSGPLEAYSTAAAVALPQVSMRNRAAPPSCMDTQIWVRGPTRSHQLVIARRVRGLTRTWQRYRSRWYQSRAFVWICGTAYTLRVGCRLYLAGPPRAPSGMIVEFACEF